MKVTRRELAATLVSAAAAAQVPAPAPTPAADLKASQDGVTANVAALAQIEIPMAAEPAFSFKA
jgi:hypothetical protein